MSRKIHNKLIRDNIPEIIRKDGKNPRVSKLDVGNFKLELRKKLIEEAQELMDAKNQEEISNEVCDVFEVLEAIIKSHGLVLTELKMRKLKKKPERGGFEKRLFLEYVED